MCILLVEDEFLILLIMAEELSDAGFEVREAANGDQAVAEITSNADAITVLVTDVHMPGGIDGPEIARRLREARPGIPVIYTTGRPDAVGERGAFGGNDVLLAKPFAPSMLVAAVRKLVSANDRSQA